MGPALEKTKDRLPAFWAGSRERMKPCMVKLGLDAKLYFCAAGIGGTPTWTELTNVKNVTLNLQKGEADVTTRANNGWKATAGTLKEGSHRVRDGVGHRGCRVHRHQERLLQQHASSASRRWTAPSPTRRQPGPVGGLQDHRLLAATSRWRMRSRVKVTAKPTYSANAAASGRRLQDRDGADPARYSLGGAGLGVCAVNIVNSMARYAVIECPIFALSDRRIASMHGSCAKL